MIKLQYCDKTATVQSNIDLGPVVQNTSLVNKALKVQTYIIS